MKKLLKTTFGIVIFLLCVVVIGRIFFFEVAKTESYSMVPNLIAGDTFLVLTRGKLGMGDLAMCRHPEQPSQMVFARIIGVPGMTFSMDSGQLFIEGNAKQREFFEKMTYFNRASDEEMEFLVSHAMEYIGGNRYNISTMERAGNDEIDEYTVQDGFYVLSDNRNRPHDSREFGEIPIENCIGRPFLIVWPAEDNGDFKRIDRFLSWIK